MANVQTPPMVPLRPASEVMRLKRMGAFFPSRLSFLPTLLRRLAGEKVRVTRPVWAMDAGGFGHAVYTLHLGGHDYSLVAVSTDLPPEQRTDRVIATAWDTAYVLFDGVPGAEDIARIVATAPRQEAARYAPSDLVLSRANKSVRLFDYVTGCLRRGEEPEMARIADTGYLMRTTAVYGNGKFGIADRARIAERPGLSGPFAAEMLTVWMIRTFTHDLAEHVGGGRLGREAKRALGIGNATGLGMAPFLVAHPLLLDAWMQVRETALARVRAVETLTGEDMARLSHLAHGAAAHLEGWHVPDAGAEADLEVMRREWPEVLARLEPGALLGVRPLDRLIRESAAWSLGTQERLVSLCIDAFPDLVDGLTECMATPFSPALDPAMPCADLAGLIRRDWGWAMELDFAERDQVARFWYVSEEKLEPRLGCRFSEDGAALESPLDIARQVQALARDLPSGGLLGEALAAMPQHRAAARRVQTLAQHPYAEIRDNLIGADCLPFDMLRCKLSFFGASHFDPKSDRWTRIPLARGAPLWDELERAGDWHPCCDPCG